MDELALFAGAGGGLLASRLLGWRTVCYVENSSYAVDVLKARIRDGYLDDAPIWDDCNTFDGHPWAGCVDILTAGFPCQPFSVAGRALAESDPRNGWPSTVRIIGEVRPPFAFLENVPGLISKPYIRRIFGDLAEIGYHAEWGTLSAASLGAPHKRERLWLVAYSKSIKEHVQLFAWEGHLQPSWNGPLQPMANSACLGLQREPGITQRQRQEKVSPGKCRKVANTSFNRLEKQGDIQPDDTTKSNWWSSEPRLGRVADGVAHRVDRLATIGNGQVPAVARAAWYLLTERIRGK